jgi:hypothetical protein
MTWEARPASMNTNLRTPADVAGLGCFFHSPRNPLFSHLQSDAYVFIHGHAAHFKANDSGDTFNIDDFESRFGDTLWASHMDLPVYYTSSVNPDGNGVPKNDPSKWLRLVRVEDPRFAQYYLEHYIPTQFAIPTQATQVQACDNGSFELQYYCVVKDGKVVKLKNEDWFVESIAELFKQLWRAGIKVAINQGSMLQTNWYKI